MDLFENAEESESLSMKENLLGINSRFLQ